MWFFSTIGRSFKSLPLGQSRLFLLKSIMIDLFSTSEKTRNLSAARGLNGFFIIIKIIGKYFDFSGFLLLVNALNSYQFSNVFLKRLIIRGTRLCRTPVLNSGDLGLGFYNLTSATLLQRSGA